MFRAWFGVVPSTLCTIQANMRTPLLVLSFAIISIAQAQPPNDQCSAVTPFDLSIGSTVTRTGTRTGATTTNDGVPTSILMNTPNVATVWESFTTTECSNVTVLYCGTSGAATTMWNFLTTTCPADERIFFSYANFGILCPNGQFGIQWFNLPAGTYYLPIYCTAAGGNYEVELSAVACIPGPVNDNCAGATPLAVNTTCVPVDGSVENGTFSFPAEECNGATGDPNDDVWFSFVATGTTHTITVDGLDGDLDITVELFGDDCGTAAPIACADATLDGGVETIEAEGLQVGGTYYLRVFHYYSSFAIEPEFTVCVTGDTGTGLRDTEGSSISIFPTATDGPVTIAGVVGGTTYRVFDRTGRMVAMGTMKGDRHVLDLSADPSGVYLIDVTVPSGRSERVSVVRH